MKKERIYHLRNILELRSNMKIVIDDAVELDEDGNFLVNVGYLRVSTDRQADLGFGLDIQEADIVRYCAANGYKNLVLYIDDGYTGTNMQRPGLQAITKAITDFNDGKSHLRINAVVVARIDRLGRTLLGTLQFIQDYIVSAKDSKNSAVNRNKEDINFVSVAENYCRIDKENPQGKFLLMLFATLAEFDRDQIVEKLKRGRQARVASGKWMGGGRAPYGYRYDKETSSLVIVPEEAKVVKEIFRLFIEEKMAPQKIADRERTLPFFLYIEGRIFAVRIFDLDDIFIEGGTEIIRDFGVEVQLTVGDQFLQCIVCAEHLGDGGNIVHCICCDGRALILRDGRSIRIIGVQAAPRILIDKPAVTDHSELCAGKTVLDIGFDQIGDQIHGLL